MNNMYDILGKMNLLEGKGSKPDFLDLDKDGNRTEPMKKAAKEVDEGSTGDYSAKKAAAGKDIGKPGKAFATIAAKAGKAYGSKERGEKVAGAVLAKLRKGAKESVQENAGGPSIEKVLDAVAKIYQTQYDGGDEIWDSDWMQDWAHALMQANPTDKELDFIIAKGHMPKRLANVDFDVGDDFQFGEGNEFSGELAKAKAAGAKQFKVDGKTYPVKEDQLDELDMKLLKGLQGAMSKNQKDPESERNIHKKYGYRSDRDDTGNDDDYDEHGNLKDKKKAKHKDDGPKKKGRPKGSGRKLGAKGPTGKSKLLRMKEDGIALVDKGEYDREGDMAKDQIHTIVRNARQLEKILGDDENLPEWVQSKMAKVSSMMADVTDYMLTQHERSAEEPIAEKAVSKQQQKFMGMVHAMQKGERIPGASKELKKVAKTMKPKDVEDFAKTKHAGLPKKVKKDEEVEETTVAGSVATAPAGGKGKKGMIFGKGVYEGQIAESFEKKLGQVLTEGMSINMSVGEDGQKSLTVNATDEDAEQLAAILKMAGLGSSAGHAETCPACGSADCGCEQMDEASELANSPDEETETTEYMTKTIAGGLNKNKIDIAGNGQTTVPVTAVRVKEDAELEQNLMNLYKQYKA